MSFKFFQIALRQKIGDGSVAGLNGVLATGTEDGEKSKETEGDEEKSDHNFD